MINPNVYKSMPFDAQKDLAPITNLLRVPLVLAVHPSIPAKNLKELHRLDRRATRARRSTPRPATARRST